MSETEGNRKISSAAALWASAFVLAALVIMQAGRMAQNSRDAARADLVSRVGDFTTLTFNAGSDDVLVILDGRAEEVFTYRIRNQTQLEMLRRYDLKNVFAEGKRVGAGRSR